MESVDGVNDRDNCLHQARIVMMIAIGYQHGVVERRSLSFQREIEFALYLVRGCDKRRLTSCAFIKTTKEYSQEQMGKPDTLMCAGNTNTFTWVYHIPTYIVFAQH